MAAKPASEGQRRYLAHLTAPERLAELSAVEASHLIGWLLGPPPNASRAQQLYLAALLERLPRERLAALIGDLAAEEKTAERPADPAPPSPPPQSKGCPQHTTRPWRPEPPPMPPVEGAQPPEDLDRLF